jgi:SAM-dependent methyltransferase
LKSTIEKVSVACNNCGSASATVVATGRDREYDTTPESFSVVQCAACGLRYLNPRPDTSELETIYPPTYHAYHARGTRTRPGLVTRLRHRLYARRLRRPLRYAGGGPIRILDVGCGDGWMLDLYRLAAGGRAVTCGIDFNERACEITRAAGHRALCARFEAIELDEQFDLVNMSHVIEHLADPRRVLEKIRDLLRPAGVLVVETPNTDTLDWRWFRDGAWGAYHIPRHWTFYDPVSIRRVGDSTGLTLREIVFHPAPVHWVWTLHNVSLMRSGVLAGLGRRVFAPLGVFESGPKAFGLLGVFTALDAVLIAATGRSSNMMAIFQRRN